MLRFRLTLAACALAFTGSVTAKPVDQVRVGFSTSISGPFAALGAEARDGFNLAMKQLGGKLGGIPAEVFATDEAGNPDTGRQHVDRYIKRDRIHFYTGPIAQKAVAFAQKSGGVMISRHCAVSLIARSRYGRKASMSFSPHTKLADSRRMLSRLPMPWPRMFLP